MQEELRQKILYLRDTAKLSFYQIEDLTGISRKRVSRIYRGYPQKGLKKRGCLLDKYQPLISSWFKEYPSLKALQVYRWLKERGVKISYPRVVQYTKKLRKKKETLYHPLQFLPGEEAQVDWLVLNHPQIGRLYGFVFLLSYSRYLFCYLFPRSSFEFFIEGHLMAFSCLKGTPHSLCYDNLKSVVLKRSPVIQYNPRFLEFARHYAVGIRLCNPGKGNEKGRVERVIRTMRSDFFNTIERCSSLKAVNQGLREWVEEKNNAIHRATGKRPVDMLKEEKLKPLPEIPWKNVSIHPPVKTTKTAMIIFDTNQYSVPDYLVGSRLSVHSTVDTVKIFDEKKQVASHPRSMERYKQSINPLHRSFSKLSNKAKMQRIYHVIKEIHPHMADFLKKNQTCGEDPNKTAYEIFKLLKTHSRGMLISIVSECLKRRSPRLKTLLSYLQENSGQTIEPVQPKNMEILNITYQPRTLDEYNHEP